MGSERFYWRNLRSLAIGFRIWLWPMAFGWDVSEDVYGGNRHFYIGPFDLSISYSIGNCSAEHWWERLGGLSEAEAWERVHGDTP